MLNFGVYVVSSGSKRKVHVQHNSSKGTQHKIKCKGS